MRTFVLGTLIAILPFSGMRVICLDAHVDAGGASAAAEPAADCERLCALHHPFGSASDPGNGSNCALSTDASSLIVFASTAVVRPEEPLQVPLVVSPVHVESPRCCLEPELARLDPPPKSN